MKLHILSQHVFCHECGAVAVHVSALCRITVRADIKVNSWETNLEASLPVIVCLHG